MVRCQARPKFMLLRAVEFLHQQKTEVPTLRALGDIILGEIRQHREKLSRSVEQSLSVVPVPWLSVNLAETLQPKFRQLRRLLVPAYKCVRNVDSRCGMLRGCRRAKIASTMSLRVFNCNSDMDGFVVTPERCRRSESVPRRWACGVSGAVGYASAESLPIPA